MLETASGVDEVMRYSLLGEGKRLRPTLVFAAHEALNGRSPDGVAELAAAVEVVHAYSLVHDDLPCMDNDDLRRGRPTAHRAFDVPRATRAGYEMVALAARILARGLAALDLPPARRREIALELFRAAGAGGMIGGQALDLEAEAKALPIDALEEVHRRKTGALIAASCVIGGLSADGQFLLYLGVAGALKDRSLYLLNGRNGAVIRRLGVNAFGPGTDYDLLPAGSNAATSPGGSRCATAMSSSGAARRGAPITASSRSPMASIPWWAAAAST